MSRTTFPVTKDVTRKMHPIKGCKPDETDVESLAAGGVNSGVIPEAGSLVFNTDGGVSEPGTPAPDDEAVVGVGVVGSVGVAVVGGGNDDDGTDDAPDDG